MKIVTLGCSFTHKYNNRIDKVWPEIVADTYSADLINLADSGKGNRRQVNELLDYIMTSGAPDKLYWLMTEWDRIDTNTHKTLQAVDYQNQIDSGNTKIFYDVVRRSFGDHDVAQREMHLSQLLAKKTPTQYTIDCNIIMIVQVQQICKDFGIDLKIIQGLQPFVYWREWYNKKKIAKEIIFSRYNKLLDLNTIIGFPFVDISGGFCLLDKPDWYDYALTPDDPHPSQKGHDYIADLFLGNISPSP